MKAKIITINPRHIKVNIFVEGALNGTLVFVEDEYKKFRDATQDLFEWENMVKVKNGR